MKEYGIFDDNGLLDGGFASEAEAQAELELMGEKDHDGELSILDRDIEDDEPVTEEFRRRALAAQAIITAAYISECRELAEKLAAKLSGMGD